MKDDCISHKGSINRAGYGQICRRINGKTKVYGAHRYAWEQANGPIPDGLFVLHSCDNRRCVNVEHLRLGTHTDNMRDASQRGRLQGRNRGVKHGRSRLTEAQVREIKTALKAGETYIHLAAKFEVHYMTIKSIANGRTWAWLAA